MIWIKFNKIKMKVETITWINKCFVRKSYILFEKPIAWHTCYLTGGEDTWVLKQMRIYFDRYVTKHHMGLFYFWASVFDYVTPWWKNSYRHLTKLWVLDRCERCPLWSPIYYLCWQDRGGLPFFTLNCLDFAKKMWSASTDSEMYRTCLEL